MPWPLSYRSWRSDALCTLSEPRCFSSAPSALASKPNPRCLHQQQSLQSTRSISTFSSRLHYFSFWFNLLVLYMILATKSTFSSRKAFINGPPVRLDATGDFSWFLRIKTTCECSFLPLFPGAFEYFVFQPPSRHWTAQMFFSRNMTLCIYQMFLSSIFMMTFIFTCLTSGITASSQLHWARCLLRSLPPGAHRLEELMPSVVSPRKRRTGLRKVTQPLYPIVMGQAYRQKSWCQPWLRSWTAGGPAGYHRTNIKLHRIRYIG